MRTRRFDCSTGMMDEKIYQRQITKQGLAESFMVWIYWDGTDNRTARDQVEIVSLWKNWRISSLIKKLPATPTTCSIVLVKATELQYPKMSSRITVNFSLNRKKQDSFQLHNLLQNQRYIFSENANWRTRKRNINLTPYMNSGISIPRNGKTGTTIMNIFVILSRKMF